MLITITVKYHSDHRTGAGKLRAIGAGVSEARRQVTIAYPYELPSRIKYHAAAESLQINLERANDWRLRIIRVDVGIEEETFTYEVFDTSVPYFGNRDAVKYGRFPAGYAS